MLQELTEVVDVTPGRPDMAVGLDDQHSLLDAGIRNETPEHARGYDDVVAGPVSKVAELCVEGAAAFMNEEDLVTVSEAIPITHLLDRASHGETEVAVRHQLDSAGDGIARSLESCGSEMSVAQRARLFDLRLR